MRDTIFKTRSPKGFLFQKYVANRAQGHKAFAQNKGRSGSDTPKKKERPRRTALCSVLQFRRACSAALNLDFDVDASRQLDALQAVDGLWIWIDDVDQTLVDAHLEVLA